MNDKVYTNKLVHEQSPYLQQHAHNPVNWYPWSDEAFKLAELEDKPIFLSIGYSTCHWCHVMEEESFNNEEVAGLMNDTFINIKVDREERPDIDKLYMSVSQIMTGSGGWPLTIIMSPDKKPFFSATYIPKNNKYNRMCMTDVIPKIKELWNNDRNKIIETGKIITNALNIDNNISKNQKLTENIFCKAYEQLKVQYDPEYGGFSKAPKFPSPAVLLFLLRYYNRYNNQSALDMAENTLEKMMLGGIYDHIGYGFHRYSTDKKWRIPHFEKMLYDQALLIMVYTEAFQITGKHKYKKIVNQVIKYITNSMTSPDGGFYSAEDADSEGIEGKFYLWTEKELKNILNIDDFNLFKKIFNIEKNGNITIESDLQEYNILYLKNNIEYFSKSMNIPLNKLKKRINTIKTKLYAKRLNKIPPFKDDKILTDWNGLMLSAIAGTARILNNNEYIKICKKNADFILKNLKINEKLFHRYKDKSAGIDAFLNDYGFFIMGLLDLYEAVFETIYLKEAILLTDTVIDIFLDSKNGGFYFSKPNDELPVRQKEYHDGVIPSGNSVMLQNLIKLNKITGNAKYYNIIIKNISNISDSLEKFPHAFYYFLTAYEIFTSFSCEIIIAGELENKNTQNILKKINSYYIPGKTLILITESDKKNEIITINKNFLNYKKINNKTTVYICKNFKCNKPITDINEIEEFVLQAKLP